MHCRLARHLFPLCSALSLLLLCAPVTGCHQRSDRPTSTARDGGDMKQRALQTLLDERDDYALCSGVADRFRELHGNRLDAARSDHERVVILVLYSYGVIGNGGFQYLFEGTFANDPYFEFLLWSYRAIGCTAAADALADALALFPGSRPPLDIETRLEVFQAVPEERREQLNNRFWDADIEQKLAAYIRKHRDAFQRLLT